MQGLYKAAGLLPQIMENLPNNGESDEKHEVEAGFCRDHRGKMGIYVLVSAKLQG